MPRYFKCPLIFLLIIGFIPGLAKVAAGHLFISQKTITDTSLRFSIKLAIKHSNNTSRPQAIKSVNSFTANSFVNKVDIRSGNFVYGIAVKDLDGDGIPDLAVVNSDEHKIAVFKNRSTPGLVLFDTPLRYAVNDYSIGIAAEDLDGDNKPDLVVTNFNANTITIFQNNSTINQLSFNLAKVLNTGSGPYNVAIGDLDADGKPDLVVTNERDYPGTISVLKNTSSPGAFSFAIKKDFVVTSFPRGLGIGDLDADGKPDVVVACQDGNVSVLKNSSGAGNINFNAGIIYAIGSGASTQGVAIADIDGDGKSDIAVTNNNDPGTVSVLRNTSLTGSIHFDAYKDFSAGANPYAIAATDIDGDGKTDMVVTNQLSSNLSVFINSSSAGNINFKPKVNFLTGKEPRTLVIADVDGNRAKDLVVGDDIGDEVSILLAQNIIGKLPSIITLPQQIPLPDGANNYNPKATSTNPETPITYTSSNTAVATITANGLVHLVGPGVSLITAHQAGNNNYEDAPPVTQTLTVIESLHLAMPAIAGKTICQPDFPSNVASSNAVIPITYSSNNAGVATVSPTGIIHIVGPGTVTIQATQNADPSLYISATPVSQTFAVTMPPLPVATIIANYAGKCLGSSITFTASATNTRGKPTYQWQINGVNAGTNDLTFASSTLNNNDMVTCIVTNNDVCPNVATVISNAIVVNLLSSTTPTVSIKASNNDVFAATPITFNATATGAPGTLVYQWQVNGINVGLNSNVFTTSALVNGDQVICTVQTDAACTTTAISQPVIINIIAKLTIPNTFTPNNDGVNDAWLISGISSYPNNSVSVFNRYGSLVYQAKNYGNNWRGLSNGRALPFATYYYVIDLGFKNTRLSGWVTLLQ